MRLTNRQPSSPSEKFAKNHGVLSDHSLGVLEPGVYERLRHRNLRYGRERGRWRDILMINEVVVPLGTSHIFLNDIQKRLRGLIG